MTHGGGGGGCCLVLTVLKIQKCFYTTKWLTVQWFFLESKAVEKLGGGAWGGILSGRG
jgi:hypothetical protein